MLLPLSKRCHLLVALGAKVRTEPLHALANVPRVSNHLSIRATLIWEASRTIHATLQSIRSCQNLHDRSQFLTNSKSTVKTPSVLRHCIPCTSGPVLCCCCLGQKKPLYSLSFVLCCFRGLGQSLNFKAELQVQNPTLQTLSQVHSTCASPSEEEGDNCSCHHGGGPSEAYRNTAGGRKALSGWD